MTEKYKFLILFALGMPVFLGCFDIMAIGIGLQQISSNLNTSITLAGWVLSAYMICNAAATISIGKICDLVDQKKIYIIGYSLFNLASLLSGISPNIMTLIISRGIQGVSICMILISATSLIHLYFEKHTVKYLGLWSFFVGAGTCAGPLLGGILLHYFGWRSIFLVNLVFALFLFPLILKYLPPIRINKQSQKINVGSLLTITGFLLSLSLIFIGHNEFNKNTVMVLVLITITLGYVEYKRRISAILIKSITSLSFINGSLAGVCSYYSLYTWLVITPLYLAKTYGASITLSGFVMLPYFIAFTFSPVFAGYIGIKKDKRNLLLFGLGFNVIGLLLVVALHSLSIWYLCIAHFVFGIGNSFINAPATALALENVPVGQSGRMTSILYAIRWISGAIGSSVASLIWVKFSAPYIAFYIAGGICLVSIASIQNSFAIDNKKIKM